MGPSIPLNYVPLGPALPSELTSYDNKNNMINPQKISIIFKVLLII